MSKKTAENVYQVLPPEGEAFYVIARHAKGALTIAREYDGRINSSAPARLVHADYATQAINGRKA